MSSNIEWTDETWNPVVGCTRKSAGCDNCYAVVMTHRLEGMERARRARNGTENGRKAKPGEKYVGLTVLNPRGDRHFNGVVRCVPEALPLPLAWKKPRRVFVNSMSDLFHESVPFEFIVCVFAVMALCPQHDFQVLTKRPERMAEFFVWLQKCADTWAPQTVDKKFTPLQEINLRWMQQRAIPTRSGEMMFINNPIPRGTQWPLKNVWLGTSCEDQAAADARVPWLLKCPAAVRFLSCEPLLGAIDLHLDRAHVPDGWQGHQPLTSGIDWVIVGGESGPNARNLHVGWVESIVKQCKAAGVAVFVKQLGRWPAIDPLPVTGDIVHACCKAANGTEVAVTRDDEGTMVLNPDISGFWRLCTPSPDLLQHRRLVDVKGGDPGEWPEALRVREMPGTQPAAG